MATFQYNFQSILEIKRKLESQAKLNYGLAQGELVKQQNILTELMIRKKTYEITAKKLVAGRINVIEINLYRNTVNSLQEQVALQAKNVKIAETKVEKARELLNEVMIERKTFEKLRERKYEEFLTEQDKVERKAVDELISYSYRQEE